MIDVSVAAANLLRTMVRESGVVGMPGVRIKGGVAGTAEDFEILIEDRAVPGDEINEARGIRFYVDDVTASAIDDATLDLEGPEFVLRQTGPAQR